MAQRTLAPLSRTLAQTECEENGWEFDDVFRFQYLITPLTSAPICLSDNWKTLEFGNWRITHCPALRASKIKDQRGEYVGLLLGIAVAPEGVALGPTYVIPEDNHDEHESWINELSGRFVLLFQIGNEERLYCDPSGNLSSVFRRETRTIASSVALTIEGQVEERTGVPKDQVMLGKFPLLFGETIDRRVERAQPNHYLELRQFSKHRHWPLAETQFALLDNKRRECFKEISERLQRNIAALSKSYTCALPVTGGKDSRVLLACSSPTERTTGKTIDHFYSYDFNWSTSYDAKLAVIIAENLAIPMQVISRNSPVVKNAFPSSFEEEERQKMQLSTGWSYKTRHDWNRSIALSPRVDVVLRGMAVEMTRANKWSHDSIQTACTAELGLTTLIGLSPRDLQTDAQRSRYDLLLKRYREWMVGLPDQAHSRLYDIAHMELWIPAGPAIQFAGFTYDFGLNPFNDRRIMQLTAGIAPRARKRAKLVNYLIQSQLPSLSDVPFRYRFSQSLRSA